MKKTMVRLGILTVAVMAALSLMACPVTPGSSSTATSTGTSTGTSSSTVTATTNITYATNSGYIFAVVFTNGVSRTMDASIMGVDDTTGFSWSNGIKYKCVGQLKDQATNYLTLNARYADGGYGKVDTTATGDLDPTVYFYGVAKSTGGAAFTVDIMQKAGVGHFAYGICGNWSNAVNTTGNYVFDNGWNGGSNILQKWTNQATQVNGFWSNQVTFDQDAANGYVFQGRQGNTNGSGDLAPVNYSDQNLTAIPANNTSNWALFFDWTPTTFTVVTNIMMVQINIAGATNASGVLMLSPSNLNRLPALPKAGVGDMWIGGRPTEILGDYADQLSASKTTNLNNKAWLLLTNII